MDHKQAMQWFLSAARQGHVKSQYNLGVMYETGSGVKRDYLRAYMWAKIAANSGDKDSITNLKIAERHLSSSQIEEAKKMAQDCIANDLRTCK